MKFRAIFFIAVTEGVYKTMYVKDYLSQYQRLDKEIGAKHQQISMLKKYEPDASSKKELEKKIGALQSDILNDIDSLISLQKEIKDRIIGLPDRTQSSILEMRYINCWNVTKIALKMDYSRESIYYHMKKGIKNFADMYNLEPEKQTAKQH